MVNLIIRQISDTIKKNFNIKEVILFGSYQKNLENEDSDIDLLVILNENGMAKNYDERLERKIKISNSLLEFKKRIPIDLLVFTQEEWKHILSYNTSFYNEINAEGSRI
jgi:predicted nucleotidyltransferase